MARMVRPIAATQAEDDVRMVAPGLLFGGVGAHMQLDSLDSLKGCKVRLEGHFAEPVVVEDVRQVGDGYEVRVRLPSGELEETVLSAEEFSRLTQDVARPAVTVRPVDAEQLHLMVESRRIRLAYAYDPHFAVSLSGIRTLPHQIEGVYVHMLPQPRLRFLLADDPGAGKTIMAGLLLKEMKLRGAIERILIIVPAPLTIQWQDDLLRFFEESFVIVTSATDQQQYVNPWQQNSQIIVSMDYAKRPGVRERIWQQHWDMVIVDEAHKCSARTKRRDARAPEVDATKRYQLVQRLSEMADHVVLLTATPHHGDDDQFAHFLRLIDPDLFPEPHKLADKARQVRRDILRLGKDCPWALRRLKEDLRDLDGRRLFPDRHARTVTFTLNREEYALYKAVTAYINKFLPQGIGRQKQSVALTRTVLQRRLASSTRAIHESLRRRLQRQTKLLEELEQASPEERVKILERLRRRLTDAEMEEGDLDEQARDRLVDEFTVAMEMDQLREEIAALRELVEQARQVREHAPDSKLAALRECLQGAEFAELRDGRGKLLIFTEHRDTLTHVREHLEQWGYSTCEIHGGMNVHERKRAQEEFRTRAQVCVATEAAGEGINLQFCHLMINYDLPWTPTRLEQRLGRIHRIGQERDVYVFNFVAEQSEDGQPVIEGRILKRLLDKLEQMREALGGRVFDVIGEVLSLNEVNLAQMLRDAAYDPRRLDDYLDRIDRVDPEAWRRYEEATGIALARAHVDLDAFHQANYEAEERRLMPEYVEKQFLKAAPFVGLKVERRADGLLRVEYVPQSFRSDRLESVRRLQRKPDESYRKITFRKEDLQDDRHLDAVLVGPGHPLYAVVDEKLNDRLKDVIGGVGVFIDPDAAEQYSLHFFEAEVRGYDAHGRAAAVYAELVAVREGPEGLTIVPPDILHDLTPHHNPPQQLPALNPKPAADFLRSGYQLEMRNRCQQDRRRFAEICREYLTKSFDVRIRAAQDRVMHWRAREAKGDPGAAVNLQQAEQDLADLERQRDERFAALERLAIARPGPLRHVASAIVLPPDSSLADLLKEPSDAESEAAAMAIAMEHERARGWEPTDVSAQKIGFDIRSLSPPDEKTGKREVRRIEVKGRKRGGAIRLTVNEWLKARQLASTYWLYVVWDPTSPDRQLVEIPDPAHTLAHAVREVQTVRYYEIPAGAIGNDTQTGG